MSYKIPVSVLVVVHTADLEVLLMERAGRPGYWQSVTGSIDEPGEPLESAAARELAEETGIEASAGALGCWDVVNVFEIYRHWRHRFAPGVRYNREHVFGFRLARRAAVRPAPEEHTAFAWLPWREAAERCFSWTNRDAIRMLGEGAVLI